MAQITLCYRGLSAFHADQVATAVGVHLNYLHAYEKNFNATTSATWKDEAKFSDLKEIVIEESHKSEMPQHLKGQFDKIAGIDEFRARSLRRTIITKSILSIVTFDIFDNIRSNLKVIDDKYSVKQEDTKFIDIDSIHSRIEAYRQYTHSVMKGQDFQVEEQLKKILQHAISDRFDDAAMTAAETAAELKAQIENGFQNTVDKKFLTSALEDVVKKLKP